MLVGLAERQKVQASPANHAACRSPPSKRADQGTNDSPSSRLVPVLRHFLADFIICMCEFDFRQAQDEAFYILEGSGSFILNDVPLPFEKGGTIFKGAIYFSPNWRGSAPLSSGKSALLIRISEAVAPNRRHLRPRRDA